MGHLVDNLIKIRLLIGIKQKGSRRLPTPGWRLEAFAAGCHLWFGPPTPPRSADVGRRRAAGSTGLASASRHRPVGKCQRWRPCNAARASFQSTRKKTNPPERPIQWKPPRARNGAPQLAVVQQWCRPVVRGAWLRTGWAMPVSTGQTLEPRAKRCKLCDGNAAQPRHPHVPPCALISSVCRFPTSNYTRSPIPAVCFAGLCCFGFLTALPNQKHS